MQRREPDDARCPVCKRSLDSVVGAHVLGPCERPGGAEDWWGGQHSFCTGSHHLGPGSVVICMCWCHLTAADCRRLEEFVLGARETDRDD